MTCKEFLEERQVSEDFPAARQSKRQQSSGIKGYLFNLKRVKPLKLRI